MSECLQDMYKSRSPLYDEDATVAHRMEAVSALGRLLQQTAPISSDEAPTQRQLYRQVHGPASCLKSSQDYALCSVFGMHVLYVTYPERVLPVSKLQNDPAEAMYLHA